MAPLTPQTRKAFSTMETLHSIKSDLVRTADHLEKLSQAMSGHARFMEARATLQSAST